MDDILREARTWRRTSSAGDSASCAGQSNYAEWFTQDKLFDGQHSRSWVFDLTVNVLLTDGWLKIYAVCDCD